MSALPSDLASYYAFEYRYSERDYEYDSVYGEFEKELHEKIAALEEAEQPSDSPVTDFLGLRHELLRRQAEAEAATLKWLLINLKSSIIKNCEICEDFARVVEAARRGEEIKDPKVRHAPMIDLFHIDVLYARLLTTGWSAFPTGPVQKLANVIGNLRENLFLAQKYWERVELKLGDSDQALDTLAAICGAIAHNKTAIEQYWDRLVDSLSDVKLRGRKRRRRRKKH